MQTKHKERYPLTSSAPTKVQHKPANFDAKNENESHPYRIGRIRYHLQPPDRLRSFSSPNRTVSHSPATASSGRPRRLLSHRIRTRCLVITYYTLSTPIFLLPRRRHHQPAILLRSLVVAASGVTSPHRPIAPSAGPICVTRNLLGFF
jgi:hypothetical protein